MDKFKVTIILLCLALCSATVHSQETVKLKIQGSTTVNPVVTEAAEIFRKEKGWTIFVDTQGGSSGGISGIGDGLIDIGMSSKPVGEKDKITYPKVNFQSYAIGVDGVALVVSAPVWQGGVHTLSQKQVQAMYENKIKNWKELGGANAPIVFYNKEPGRGTWSVFADWAYDGHKNAPNVSHPEVGSNEETRNKVSFHPSAISQLSFAWVEGTDKIKAVGIEMKDGRIVYPTLSTIQDGSYPLARKLYVVTNGEAKGYIKEFIDFLLSDRGQKLVEKHGYIRIQ